MYLFDASYASMVKMRFTGSVYDESAAYVFVKTMCSPALRPATIRCIKSIFYNFFFRQYKAAWLPGRVPVSNVDHSLDQKIPFVPAWVTIYLDFVTFWIRMLSFLLRSYGRGAFAAVREFISSMGALYAFAAEAYQKNFSTTNRPFYIARPRFLVIHMFDPHLMCIPSLHVMVVIRTYTKFAAILRSLNEADHCSAQIDEVKQGALAITQAILFVKQHSVNCVSAALYAMTCFDGELFPPEEAEAFTSLLFGEAPQTAPLQANHPLKNYQLRPDAAPRTKLPAADIAEIKAHILGLYRRFLTERKTLAESADSATSGWEEPLLRFMRVTAY
jgi:hypothetical protein